MIAAGVLVPPGYELGDEYEYMGYTSQEMNEFAFTALSRRLKVIGVGLPTVPTLRRSGEEALAAAKRGIEVAPDGLCERQDEARDQDPQDRDADERERRLADVWQRVLGLEFRELFFGVEARTAAPRPSALSPRATWAPIR